MVVNKFNSFNDQAVDVRANNIDQHGVVFHSHFYNLIPLMPFDPADQNIKRDLNLADSTIANFINFKVSVVNHPSLRAFLLQNITTSNLVLNIKVNPENKGDIEIYQEQYTDLQPPEDDDMELNNENILKKAFNQLADSHLFRELLINEGAGGTPTSFLDEFSEKSFVQKVFQF